MADSMPSYAVSVPEDVYAADRAKADYERERARAPRNQAQMPPSTAPHASSQVQGVDDVKMTIVSEEKVDSSKSDAVKVWIMSSERARLSSALQ